AVAQEQTLWTCPMHPNIRVPEPGKCPICFMDLVPSASSDSDIGERQISFSEAAIKLMEIETTAVERKFVTAEIRMAGKVDYDETRVKHITAWVPGRIDRLYVDFTGVNVTKGDHMVYLYSGELLVDQQALLAAISGAKNVRPENSTLATRLKSVNVEAVRTRLRLRGLTDKQIAEIEESGKPVTHLTIYSPIGGTVIEKKATEGMYVDEGTHIYTVADLTHLWVKLDAYESDLSWIQYGQDVEFTTEAYPGEVFKGKISFRDPVLNAKTRTVKLRVNVDNTEGKLKPEMFVRAVVRANVAQGGMVMIPEMAGKWICPMHPAVVKTEAGNCNICGMDLVTTESLGYVKVDTPNEAPLVIPASVPLITGTRAVVYVKVPKTEKPTYEGREVVLGPRTGDYYIVKSGLAEGEIVVTNGNFKIDSALQIQAKPSMMSARDVTDEHKHKIIEVSEDFKRQFRPVIEDYLMLQKALAADDVKKAIKSVEQALKSLSGIDMGLLGDQAHKIWMQSSAAMTQALKNVKKEGNIEQLRKAFKSFSDEVIITVTQFQVFGPEPLYRINCSMAFDNKGADWLQIDKDTRNPYFGASMLKCGRVIEVIGDKTK
ncbi:MAG: efflux RND transporter periplasmic adaptor subunit, partial [Planctomycetota bacterium]